jgi:pantetheine-phosphate adenylyltransferase
MKNIAVFPGSFDPITIGHESVIKRALPLFDELYVAIGTNSDKTGFFPVEQRIEWIKRVFADNPEIKVIQYEGLTVDICRKLGAQYILRGLRTSADFEFERSIGQVNKKLFNNIETVFFLTLPEHTSINSSIVRDIVRHGGDASDFVPKIVDLSDYYQ